jgi:hypothetical protein
MTEEVITLPDLTPMHVAVGKGISTFSSLELAVGMVFASMLEPAPRLHSITVLNSARSFEAKMKMVDALADVALTDSQLKRWRNLSSKIGRRKDMRDRLAHWMVSHFPGAKTVREIKKMKPALVPPVWSKQHMEVIWDPKTNRKSKPIFLPQLLQFDEDARKLTTELFKFSSAVRPKAASAKT